MPYASDGSITYTTMIERFNSDLANTLGNLVNRTIAMSNKYLGGKVLPNTEKEPIDDELINTALNTVTEVDNLMSEFRVSDALDKIFGLARRSNKYIDETEPWVLGKDESKKARLSAVVYNLLESIRFIGVLLSPFMPDTSKAIFEQLNTDVIGYDSLKQFGGLVAGSQLGQA